MISFQPTEEEAAIREVACRFAVGQVRPALRTCEEQAGLPPDLQRLFWKLGVALLHYSREVGGAELGLRTMVVAEEELAWGDAAIAVALPRPGLAGEVLDALDTPDARVQLSCLVGGSPRRSAMVLVNQDSTSIALQRESPDVVGADHAECLLAVGMLDADLAIAALPVDGTGWTFRPEDGVLGLRAARLGTISMERCLLPRDRLLAWGPDAVVAVRQGLLASLLRWSAWAVGLGRASFEYAAQYATQRRTFGRSIAEHQAVAFMIADMGTLADAARSLVWEAAWAVDTSRADAAALVSAGARYAADEAVRITTDAVQALGGHGYVRDHPVEKWMRDARTLANVIHARVRYLESLPTQCL